MSSNKIDADIEAFRKEIEGWHSYLDQRSLWLFTSVVACWGITNFWFQLTATVFVFVVFFRKAIERVRDGGKYTIRLGNFRRFLFLLGDKRYEELDALEAERLTLFSILRHSWAYLFCMLFSFGSLVFFIFSRISCCS